MRPEQRAVFVLFEIEEMLIDAIAELIEIPRGTVQSRLRLARNVFHATVARMHERERFHLRTGEA